MYSSYSFHRRASSMFLITEPSHNLVCFHSSGINMPGSARTMVFKKRSAMAGPPVGAPAFRSVAIDRDMALGSLGGGPMMLDRRLMKPNSTIVQVAEEPIPLLEEDRFFGWDLAKVVLEPLPAFFPKSTIDLELPIGQRDKVLKNVMKRIKSLSIQAVYKNNPLSAELRTLEHIDLYFDCWSSPKNDTFYIAIQQRQRSSLVSNRYIHKILEAAKGNTVDDDMDIELNPSLQQIKPNPQTLLKIESLSAGVHKYSPPASSSSSLLDTIYDPITSERPDMRKVGFELLSSYTDLTKTISSAVVPSALLLLAGKSPSPQEANKCKQIQRIALTVLQKREFEGDEALFSELLPMAVDPSLEFMSLQNKGMAGKSRHYVEYMSKIFLLALTAFVNSLEAAILFKDQLGEPLETIVQRFLSAGEDLFGTSIYDTLLDCVKDAKSKLSEGYLACKALRLLIQANTSLRLRMMNDVKLKHEIERAIAIGDQRHALLGVESKLLRECLQSFQ